MNADDQQLIISIDREFGSGGKEIGMILANRYEIPFFEKNILSYLNLPSTQDVEDLFAKDEAPRWKLASRTVRGLTNSNEQALAQMEFDFLKDMAAQGKSFVIMGHVAEEILKDYPGLVTIFVGADEDFKIPRIMMEHEKSEEEARKMMVRHDLKRKAYHNNFSQHKWGDSRRYDLCIRSDKLGAPATADFIQDYIEKKRALQAAKAAESASSQTDESITDSNQQ